MKKALIPLLLSLLALGGYLWLEDNEWDNRIKEVEGHLEKGNLKLASTALEALLDESPDDSEALSLFARIQAFENPRKALEILRRLHASNEATWQDLALLVEIMQDTVEIPVDREILAELQKGHADEPMIASLLAKQDFLEGRIDDALRRLAEISIKYPNDRGVRLQRARIMLLSPDLTARIEAKHTLFELGQKNDWASHKALRALIDRETGPIFFPDDLLKASIALQRHPLTGDATYLRAASLRLQYEPHHRKDILAAAIERLGESQKVLLAVWLNTVLAPSLALKTISLKEAVTDGEKFLPFFQALLLLKRNPEARQLRKDADDALDESTKMRADYYLEFAEEGGSAAFDRFVQSAANSGDQQLLIDVGRMSLLAGRGEESWNAYLKALQNGGEGIGQPVGLQLLQLALHHRETKVAWKVAKLLTEQFPRRAGNRNNFAYLSLLLNLEVTAATQAAENSVSVAPRNSAFLSTLALARFRGGQFDEARELMERRGELGLTPGERATKAAIFLALERTADAALVAQGLRSDMMLPEEWDLLGEVILDATSKP